MSRVRVVQAGDPPVEMSMAEAIDALAARLKAMNPNAIMVVAESSRAIDVLTVPPDCLTVQLGMIRWLAETVRNDE